MKNRRLLYFVLMWLFSLALWWHPLAKTVRLALDNSAYTHILLILPLACALIYQDRAVLTRTLQPNRALGGLFLVVALLLASLAKWGLASTPGDIRLSMSMLGLVIAWAGIFISCFGTRSFRGLLFPICFLFLLVPLPDSTVAKVVDLLQQQSADAARIMFQVAHVPVRQAGVILSIPDLDIAVAQECSSIRSSFVLIITTMFLAQVILRSWWRRLLLIFLSVPLSVVKNGLRIFTIAELGTRVDPWFIDGPFHHHGGVIFLGIALAVIAVLIWVLRRSETVASHA